MDTVEREVVVPDNPDLAKEPALTVGDIFKNKALVKTFVVAVVGIAAGFGLQVAPGVADSVVDIVWFLTLVATAGTAQAEVRQRADQQAKATRDQVYAPETAANLVRLARTNPDAVRVVRDDKRA